MRACHGKSQTTRMRGQYYFNWDLRSLSVCSCSCEDSRVPPLNLYYNISIAEDFHCLKAVETAGKHGRIRRFTVGPVYSNKSLTMCSSDFVFRKNKQDSAFRVSGVLQLDKAGPPVTKSFPLRCLFPSDAMMAWRFHTPYDVKCANLHILTARGMSHILTRIGQLWSSRKNSYALVRSPNSKITTQRIIDVNIIEWKSTQKFLYIGTLREILACENSRPSSLPARVAFSVKDFTRNATRAGSEEGGLV